MSSRAFCLLYVISTLLSLKDESLVHKDGIDHIRSIRVIWQSAWMFCIITLKLMQRYISFQFALRKNKWTGLTKLRWTKLTWTELNWSEPLTPGSMDRSSLFIWGDHVRGTHHWWLGPTPLSNISWRIYEARNGEHQELFRSFWDLKQLIARTSGRPPARQSGF